jgi:AraC family transcriptional regulator
VPSRVLHESAAVTVGTFRSRPGDRDFADSGPTRGHLLVFPREAVAITHAGGTPVVADPSVVMTYNRGQAYARAAISRGGDRSEWFAYPASAILEARGDPDGDRDRPFGEAVWAPGDARRSLLAGVIAERVSAGDLDELFVEEAAALLLERTFARRAPAPVSRAHAELADAVRRSIAVAPAARRSLGSLAREHGVSMFHLARVFRRATGCTIHRYRTQLRILVAIERLAGAPDLAALAVDLGFASHSHFTAAFRALCGMTPSHVRRDPAGAASKILTARRAGAAR